MRPTVPASRPTRFLIAALALVSLAAAIPQARAQRSGDLGMTYIQERTKFVGNSTDDFFYLRGASVNLGVDFFHGVGLAVSGTGIAGTNLGGNVDIHHVELLVGPRYTYNLGHITPTTWGRRGGIFVEGKVGYTFATAGVYPVNGVNQSNASALTYTGGGGINVHIYQRFDLRLIQADYVRSSLPNGGTNQQNNIRLAAGINVHIGN